MRIDKATERYEAWLGEQIPLIRADLNRKHALMRDGVFPFFRGTFYRWAQTWPDVCPELMTAPEVLGVGDLHVENFGTWRDVEGRLVWGINDFDEVCWVPYTCDLVRLTASAHLAIGAGHLKITAVKASKSVLAGYNAGLKAGGRPFVLAEHHTALRQMAVERLRDPEGFWAKLIALPTLRGICPAAAEKAIRRLLPEELKHRVAHRVSGVGSLGRRRFVAIGELHGGSIAREAKELAISAWLWARPRRRKHEILYQDALDRSVRCLDPFVRVRGSWIVRRLAPDCSRIELSSLPTTHDACRLLSSMGWETANVHLGSRDARTILQDLNTRGVAWLHHAAQAMVESTRQDWEDWKKFG